ncbi:MAG: hypothetical protein IKO96_03910, partial [Spirochaetales bacterium]|nr:hypothetical protein [Spirochaetales bacterium]
PRFKEIPLTLLTTVVVSFTVFLFNMFLRKTGICPKVNYFFSVETEGNPVLDLFNSWIPVPYLYLMPALVVIGIYMSVVNFFFMIFGKKKASESQQA